MPIPVVRIPLGAWMSVSCTVFVLSGRGLCDGPIPRPEETYSVGCVSECDQVKINNLDTCCGQVGRRRKDCETNELYFHLSFFCWVSYDELESPVGSGLEVIQRQSLICLRGLPRWGMDRLLPLRSLIYTWYASHKVEFEPGTAFLDGYKTRYTLGREANIICLLSNFSTLNLLKPSGNFTYHHV
jgi:hypothetical protein